VSILKGIKTGFYWMWPSLLIAGLLGLFSVTLVNYDPLEYHFSPGLESTDSYLTKVFSPEINANFTYRWTSPEWFIDLPNYPPRSSQLSLTLLSLQPQPVHIFDYRGVELFSFTPTMQLQEYKFSVPANSVYRDTLHLTIRTQGFTLTDDGRSLGLLLNQVDAVPQKGFIWPTISFTAAIVGLGVLLGWILTGLHFARYGWHKRPLWSFIAGFSVVVKLYLPVWFNTKDVFQLPLLINLILLSMVMVIAMVFLGWGISKGFARASKKNFGQKFGWNLPSDWIFLLGLGLLTSAFLYFSFAYRSFHLTLGDTTIYYKYASQMLNGAIPYRDFTIEYPPFSIPFILLPGYISTLFGGSVEDYLLAFQFESYLLAVGILVIISWFLRKKYPAPSYTYRVLFLGLAFPLISFFLFRRFDAAPAFLLVLSFYLLYLYRPVWSGFFLGLAASAKLYPLLVLPLLLIYFWRNKGNWKFTLWLSLGFMIAIGISVIPFLIISPNGLAAFLQYQGERGLQIESLFASIAWLGSQSGFAPAIKIYDHNSTGYVSSWTSWLLPLSTLLSIGGMLALLGYFWWTANPKRTKLDKDWLLYASFLVITWFIISNKVISPQYMIWLIPFFPFLKTWRVWIGGVILALSAAAYLFEERGVDDYQWQPMFITLIRNSLLLLLFASQLIDIIRKPVTTPYRIN
jgi:hypothetical protein